MAGQMVSDFCRAAARVGCTFIVTSAIAPCCLFSGDFSLLHTAMKIGDFLLPMYVNKCFETKCGANIRLPLYSVCSFLPFINSFGSTRTRRKFLTCDLEPTISEEKGARSVYCLTTQDVFSFCIITFYFTVS